MPHRRKPSPEPPRLRKEYMVLFAIVVGLTLLFANWCGPAIRNALQ